MEKIFARAENLAGSVKEYVQTNIELAKLEAAEKSAVVISSLVEKFITAVMVFFFLALASVALAIYLGEVIGKSWAGFLIVAGIYLLAAIIVWATKKSMIHTPITNAVINQLLNKNDEDEKDQ